MPWFSMGGAALAVVVWFCPGVVAFLEYDRARPFEVWRILTCHLTHWTADTAFWDIAVFATLGAVCEAMSRRRMLFVCAVSAAAVCAGVWAFEPGIAQYRGLSGVDSALFGLAACVAFRRALGEGRSRVAVVIAGSFLLFAAKTIYEARTGSGFFAPAEGAAMRALPVAHLAGMASGVIVGAWAHSPKQGLLRRVVHWKRTSTPST